MKNLNNSHKAPFLINEKYEEKLAEVKAALTEKRIALQLPPLTSIQEDVLANKLTFGCFRIAKFLFNNQCERTDRISQRCAVGNVSDAVIGFEKNQTTALAELGLTITCNIVPARNRFGVKSVIGTWFIEIVDEGKWIEAGKKTEIAA